jgi:hypothetical protein
LIVRDFSPFCVSLFLMFLIFLFPPLLFPVIQLFRGSAILA